MDDIKDLIAREIIEATGYEIAPDWAMTFAELMEKTGMTEDRLRKHINALRSQGKWKSGWYGGTYYYWPIEPPEEAA